MKPTRIEPPLHIRTPLLESLALSQRSGKRIFLKMENMQPSGSFKSVIPCHAVYLRLRRGPGEMSIMAADILAGKSFPLKH